MIYVIVVYVNKDTLLKIGKLGDTFFKKGFYAYIGSAMKGWRKRIERHIRKEKKKRWHIDYLTTKFRVIDVFIKEDIKTGEEKIASIMENNFSFVKRFGSSDTKNKSHLFFSEKAEEIRIFLIKKGFFRLKYR